MSTTTTGSDEPGRTPDPRTVWEETVRLHPTKGFGYRAGEIIVHTDELPAITEEIGRREAVALDDGLTLLLGVEDVPGVIGGLRERGHRAYYNHLLFAAGDPNMNAHPGPMFPHPGPMFPHPGPMFPHPGPMFPHPGPMFPHPSYGWTTGSGCGCCCNDAAHVKGCGATEMPNNPPAPTRSSVDVAYTEPALQRPATAAIGRPIKVVILDSGLVPSAAGGQVQRVTARPGEPWGPPGKGGVVRITDNLDPADAVPDRYLDPISGHGTFIAGLIARLAPTATITIGKVLEATGQGSDSDMAFRINRLVDEGAPDILCLSSSCYAENDEAPPALALAVAKLQAAGTTIVAAAGNEATCRVSWPSAMPGVIAVAALGWDGPASFTNYGDWVDACAPGVFVVSRFHDGVDYYDDLNPKTADFHGWAKWCGTSFSAPIVAAAIAREAALYGITVTAAADRVVFDPRLFRLPGLGTVVNMH